MELPQSPCTIPSLSLWLNSTHFGLKKAVRNLAVGVPRFVAVGSRVCRVEADMDFEVR